MTVQIQTNNSPIGEHLKPMFPVYPTKPTENVLLKLLNYRNEM